MANRDGKGDVAHSPQDASRGRAAFVPPRMASLSETRDPKSEVRPPLLATRTPSRLNDVELRRRFGAIVRAERNRRALSQGDLAFRSKLHRTHVSLAECGRRDLRMTTICALAAALHVQPGELMPPLP